MPFLTTTEDLTVVILYERLAYVGKAVATYLHLQRDLATEFATHFRLWRIDAALSPALAAEAERDIAEAEVIIMAVDGRQQCPEAFRRWKLGAGHQGGQPPHAIIALMDASAESAGTQGSWSNVLHDTATEIHSEVYICDHQDPIGAEPMAESIKVGLD
jgi:hypothetical protein